MTQADLRAELDAFLDLVFAEHKIRPGKTPESHVAAAREAFLALFEGESRTAAEAFLREGSDTSTCRYRVFVRDWTGAYA